MKARYLKRTIILIVITGMLTSACGVSSQTEINRRVSATLTAEAQISSAAQQKADQYMSEYGFIPIATGDPDISVIAVAGNGEKLAVMTDSDPSGNVTAVNGAVWVSPDDEVIVLLTNKEGLPDRLIVQEHVLVFSNYTESTVDIAVVSPDGKIDVSRGVPIDLSKIRQFSLKQSPVKLSLRSIPNQALSLVNALKFASIALGIATCATTVMGTIGSAGALIALLIASCGGLLLDIADLALPEEIRALESVSFALDAAECATSLTGVNQLLDVENLLEIPGAACASLVIRIAQYSIEWASASESNVDDSVTLAEAALVHGSGSVQITLTWDNTADIDLWVTEPSGEKIGYEHPDSATSGTLDVDDTDGYGPENIFWPLGAAPSGEYIVQINHFSGSSPTHYDVLVQINGQSQTFAGTITSEQWITITIFEQ